jgi:hypothetical protein
MHFTHIWVQDKRRESDFRWVARVVLRKTASEKERPPFVGTSLFGRLCNSSGYFILVFGHTHFHDEFEEAYVAFVDV